MGKWKICFYQWKLVYWAILKRFVSWKWKILFYKIKYDLG
jgi:hypothetical protein